MKKILITVCSIPFILGIAVLVNQNYAAANSLGDQVPQAIEAQQSIPADTEKIADHTMDSLDKTNKAIEKCKACDDTANKTRSLKDRTQDKFREMKNGITNKSKDKRGCTKECPKGGTGDNATQVPATTY